MKKDTTQIVLRPIGTIRTPFLSGTGTPIQSRYAGGAEGIVELLAEYEPGLRDIAGFGRRRRA